MYSGLVIFIRKVSGKTNTCWTDGMFPNIAIQSFERIQLIHPIQLILTISSKRNTINYS